MGKQKRNQVSSGVVAMIFLFAVTAWAQGGRMNTMRCDRRARRNWRQSWKGFDVGNVTEPSQHAITEVPALNKATSPATAPCGGEKQVIQIAAGPASSDTQAPATFTVRASALLELHEMRESAVDLCLQLPVEVSNAVTAMRGNLQA